MEKSSGNTKSLSDSILEFTSSTKSGPSFPEGLMSDTASSTSSGTGTGTGSGSVSSPGFLGISYVMWLFIILFLAFIGFNIFSYLSTGTEQVTSIFAPLFEKLFGMTVSTATETVDVAAEGGKAVVSGTATTVNSGLTAVQEVTPMPKKSYSSVSSTPVEDGDHDTTYTNSVNQTLNESSKPQNTDMGDYVPHEASSSVHAKESGWCFIGRDKGVRTCSKVSTNDICMSGDIFPSHEICVNPTLRE